MENGPAPDTPELLTDLKKVESLALRNVQKNIEFARFLKTQDPQKIESLIKEIAKDVSSHIDCTECAHCCKSLVVAPDYRDISVLATHFEIPAADFKKKYFKKDSEGDLVFKQKPCPFLKNNRCSVYDHRPQLCRRYPYLDQGNVVAELDRFLRNLSVCPIAYNTFELLKLRFA